MGRYAQGGLIRERFAPRLLRAAEDDNAVGDAANLDPFRAWTVMMTGEKPGGHGERCVAVGTLDMALWGAAAKIAGLPLHRLLSDLLGRDSASASAPVYASGGYPYPDNDITQLPAEMRHFAPCDLAELRKRRLTGFPVAPGHGGSAALSRALHGHPLEAATLPLIHAWCMNQW